MKIGVLLKRLDGLEQRTSKLEDENVLLKNENTLLKKENRQLRKENTSLKDRLSSFENPKNSSNSSIPPSKDENRPKRNQSLRESSGKKPGGQFGRKGKTLEMAKNPDQVIDLEPDYCNGCGKSLESFVPSDVKARQIVDIPVPKAIFTEYRTYAKTCACGRKSRASFPENVGSPVSYGPRTESLIGYFHARQHLPFARMKEMFNDVFGLNISEGGIHYLLERFSQKTIPAYQQIKERIAIGRVVGTDETGARVGGAKDWFWTWQNQNLTYIVHSDNRGSATIEREFPDGFPGSILVRDGWRAQAATVAEHHQLCLAHLQRRLNYLNEKYSSAEWGKDFSQLLKSSLKLEKQDRNKEKYKTNREKIIQKMEQLLERPPDKNQKELYSFYKRMAREKQNLFTFLFIEGVPPDNNGSERAVRNIKVKQKISGQFKLGETAQNFAQIRSVIDTTIKNGLNVLDALSLIAKLEA
jgi:transposase